MPTQEEPPFWKTADGGEHLSGPWEENGKPRLTEGHCCTLKEMGQKANEEDGVKDWNHIFMLLLCITVSILLCAH